MTKFQAKYLKDGSTCIAEYAVLPSGDEIRVNSTTISSNDSASIIEAVIANTHYAETKKEALKILENNLK